MAGNGGCDGLKIVKIGQSAAELLQYKINVEEGPTTMD